MVAKAEINMKKEEREFIKEELNKLLKVDFACKEAKEAANKWLMVAGSDQEDEETLELVKELKEDVETIGDIVKFASSKYCEEAFGVEGAKKFKKHANDLLNSGAKYCDCAACTAALNVIHKFDKEF